MSIAVFLQKLHDAGVTQDTLKRSDAMGTPNRMLFAIITVESSGDAKAMRYEEGYRWICNPEKFAKINKITVDTEKQLQSFSYGLCQIMGATARDNGYTGPLTDHIDPNFNIRIATSHLAKLMMTYKNWPDVISAYNQGSPKKKLMSKKYKNQAYVDKVLNTAKYFGW